METDYSFDWRGFMRAHRGGLEPIILDLLKERPMHGYEVMKTLEERSHGVWRPSAGSVYPILQLLEDQDLVSVSEKDGKKIYTITQAGIAHAATNRPPMPWEALQHRFPIGQIKELMPLMMSIKQSIRQIMMEGSKEDQAEVARVIKAAAQEIEKIAKNRN